VFGHEVFADYFVSESTSFYANPSASRGIEQIRTYDRAGNMVASIGLIGAHRLRHTTATAMLHAGGSLTEIGQIPRHRRVLTTAVHAKVDRQALRLVARPWPGEAA
jgi:site-specific recombinase XerD